ncbi:uncharacterized protein F4807DRAFT_27982 [Annulohypoxylon truncatum]|uniref:uncharacterized protein n=1 Tax=Annulohypoxylon truncatum TaxID=327061 RepID=UPI0020077A7E|nr:uncharacterized protein F4807DRAFT_27982 [Annulohypoxylon truncatum]KAI1211187.1 hypothetical protein F4807DRAFT_27982 [Annulohypoxylon truncatum]
MPSFLIPARNSRHRTACLALYRALLKQAPTITLPGNLIRAWGPGNPIKHLIRRSFRRNLADTSPRIVFPALKAGYQMLALLKASSPPSVQWARNLNHESVIAFLRARLRERNATLAAKELHPPNSRNPPKLTSAPRKDTVPLLVDVTPAPTPENPRPTPVFATPHRPRPAEELGGTGKRHVPRLDLAFDIPFLRIKKPQPPVLSRVLHQKIKKRVERFESLGEFSEFSLPEAELEDMWEKGVGELLKRHQNSNSGDGGRSAGNRIIPDNPEVGAIYNDIWGGETFQSTTRRHALDYIYGKLNEERVREVARADAMRKLIEEETALAEQEKIQRIQQKRAMKWGRKLARAEGKTEEPQGEQWEKLEAASKAASLAASRPPTQPATKPATQPVKQKERESRPVQFLE